MNKPEIKSGLMAQSPVNRSTKKISSEDLKKQIQRMRDRDAEEVTGIFKNLENPASNGGRGKLCFGYKYYPGETLTAYELYDGERYRIPRGVARHLNNNCFYTQATPLRGDFGDTVVLTGNATDGRMVRPEYNRFKKIHRYQFHSLEYMDDDADMYPSNLVEVRASV